MRKKSKLWFKKFYNCFFIIYLYLVAKTILSDMFWLRPSSEAYEEFSLI